MANLAETLRTEILRLARKEIRKETQTLKAQVLNLKKELSGTKASCLSLQRDLRRLQKALPVKEAPVVEEEEGIKHRFRTTMLSTFASKHGLKAPQLGKLLGGSTAAAYLWLEGNRPRKEFLDAFYKVRSLPKREIQALLSK